MTIENHPVWPFEPNWTSSVGESLEWLTDVLMSPTGSEQRRSMRYFPRRVLDFTIAAEGPERSLLDNLMMSYAARDWYLPVWYDVTVTTAQSTTTSIPCIPGAGIEPGTVIFIAGDTVYDYQIAEVSFVGASSINLTAPLARAIPIGSRIFPMTVGRLTEMPQITAMTDSLVTAEPQFLITEKPKDTGVDIRDAGLLIVNAYHQEAGLVDEYSGFHVFTLEPDWSDRLDRGQQRLLDTIESATGMPEQVDTARRPFPTQRHQWVLEGAGDHAQFYALAQVLRGRATPVWVPTWMDDMRLAAPTAISGSTVTVARCGFTLAGGPRPEREHIMIETVDGRRIYRRITNSAVAGTNETLLLSAPIGEVLSPSDVLRICFMSLMRLDHDSIEIDHTTDLEGVSEVQVTFRAAPNTRVAEAAFYD